MSRVFVPGVSVHVIRRGINRCAIFRDDDDREIFLSTIRDAIAETDVQVHGVILMDTHYHAIATPPTESAIPDTMKILGERYVEYFNDKYSRIGTLWTGKYRAIPLQTERYWLTCLRYIEQNPVRAGMVRTPGDYRWSSYHAHAQGTRSSSFEWLTDHPLYRSLGATPAERQETYRAICGVALTEEQLQVQRHPPRMRPQALERPAAKTVFVQSSEDREEVRP